MKREFLINILFLLFVNILIKPVYVFFIDSKAQDVLGTSIYGEYFALFNLALILSIFTDLGIQNYNSRLIAQNNDLHSDYLPKLLGVKLILSALILIFGFILVKILGYSDRAVRMFMLIIFNQVILSFILYLRTNIAALGKYRWDSIISTIDKALLIGILGIILYSSRVKSFDIFEYILSQTFTLTIVLIVVLVINFKLAETTSITFNFNFLKEILIKSLPYSLVVILMSAYMRLDGFLLERILPTPEEAGIYAAAFRIFDAFNNVGYLFAALLLPMFASLLTQNEKLIHLIKSSHNLLLILAATGSVLSIIYSDDIMKVLYPNNYTVYYSDILTLLMVSFFGVSMNYIYGTLLTAAGKVSIINKIVFGALIFNLIFNLILIPYYGAKGAAITNLLTQYFVFILQYYFCVKQFNIGFKQKDFFVRTVFILVFIIVVILINKYVNIYWLFSFIISAIISLILASIFNLISIKDLKIQ